MKQRQTQLHRNVLARPDLIVVRKIITGGRTSTPSSSYNLLATAFGFFLILTTGCHRVARSTATVVVQHQITPSPAQTGPALVMMQLTDATAKPLSHAVISIEAEMSHPGMGPAFTDAREIAPGSYQAAVDFTMRGDWILLLHIKLLSGEVTEQRIDVGGVGSH